MVSMKDIAQKCHVSVATVSKALNGYSDVGPEKREEIKRTAEKMGYLPNSSARALKTKRTYNLGILFADRSNSGLTHDYFNRIMESFKVTAESKGYDITFTSNNIGNRRMSYYEHCRYRGLDGVVIACVDFYTPEVQELIRSSIPVVTIDHVFDGRIAVVSDNAGGMKELTEYVCSMGHRKIAYVHGMDSATTRLRMGSFYRTLDAYGIEIPDSYVKEGDYRDVELAEQLTLELLDLSEPPTCIMYPDDYAAVGGINAIKERGLCIPGDVSVTGYDGIPLSGILMPQLTTLYQDMAVIGRRAAEELIALIEHPKTALEEKIVVPGRLIKGGSVRKLAENEHAG